MMGKKPWNKGKSLGPLSPSHRQKISSSNTGKHMVTTEHRQKLLKSRKDIVLTKSDVSKIRRIYSADSRGYVPNPIGIGGLARRFGVCKSTISKILSGKTWKVAL
jgi:hypothetical protein